MLLRLCSQQNARHRQMAVAVASSRMGSFCGTSLRLQLFLLSLSMLKQQTCTRKLFQMLHLLLVS